MKKFITIEGIDGVGKSTISKKLAENMGAEFIQTPYFKKHAEKDCEDKFSYYLDDLIQLKSILKEELKEKIKQTISLCQSDENIIKVFIKSQSNF